MGYLHEAAVDRDVERAHQVGQKNEGIVEYPNDCQLASRSAGANLTSKLAYALLYLFF
jgi:hypothetical protein